jgi:hypothetical protein
MACAQQWSLYAGCHGGMDERELRQQLLNCAVGPLEAVMYDALGSKVDTLSETNLMKKLEKLAVVKTVAVMQAVDYPAMISEENPVQQPTAHSSPAHRSPAHSSPTHRSQAHSSPTHIHNQPALAQRGIASMTMDSAITKLCYQCGKVTHTDKMLADQCRLMTAIASMTMDSAITKLCYQCGKVTHTDKILAD